MSPRPKEHGTPEGYEAGCAKHDKCPATPVHGLSCETAYFRFISEERRYMDARRRDPRAAAIARRLGLRPTPVTPSPVDAAITIREETTTGTRAAGSATTRRAPVVPKPAQPLAERAHDTAPQEDAGDPAIETEEPTAPSEPATKVEAMGHPTHPQRKEAPMPKNTATRASHAKPTKKKTAAPRKAAHAPEITTDRWTHGLTPAQKTRKLREIRDWCRANGFPSVPVKGRIAQDALAAYAAHSDVEVERAEQVDAPTEDEMTSASAAVPLAPSNDFTDILDETRERISDVEEAAAPVWRDEAFEAAIQAAVEQAPPLSSAIDAHPRPEWGDVPEGRDELLTSREEARSLAVRLEQELAKVTEERDAAQRSMVLALIQWADGQKQLEAARRHVAAATAEVIQARRANYAHAKLRRAAAAQHRRFLRRSR